MTLPPSRTTAAAPRSAAACNHASSFVASSNKDAAFLPGRGVFAFRRLASVRVGVRVGAIARVHLKASRDVARETRAGARAHDVAAPLLVLALAFGSREVASLRVLSAGLRGRDIHPAVRARRAGAAGKCVVRIRLAKVGQRKRLHPTARCARRAAPAQAWPLRHRRLRGARRARRCEALVLRRGELVAASEDESTKRGHDPNDTNSEAMHEPSIARKGDFREIRSVVAA